MVALCRALLSCSLKESRALFQFEYPVLINASLLFCVCCFPNRRQEKQKVEFKFTEYSNHSNVSNQFFWKALFWTPNWSRGYWGSLTCFGPVSEVPKSVSLFSALGCCSNSNGCCLSLFLNWSKGYWGSSTCFGPISWVPKTTSSSAAFGWCSTSKSCCLSLLSVMYQSRVTSLAVCYFSTINEQYNFFYSLIKSDDNCFSLYKTENTGNE